MNRLYTKLSLVFRPSLVLFGFSSVLIGLIFSSCHNQKKNTNDFKPMKPTGSFYSAYSDEGLWALEMDLNGNFFFEDFSTGFEIQSKTTEFIGKKEGPKQKLEWNMFNGNELEQQIRFSILQENCHNFGYVNNPFILEVFHHGGLIYQLGACGTFQNQALEIGKFKLLTANGQSALSVFKLSEAPILELKKVKTSNMIHGRFACRYWQGQIKPIDLTLSINFNIHPTEDCVESPELSACMQSIGNKNYTFQFSKDAERRTILTLSDKNNIFAFLKLE